MENKLTGPHKPTAILTPLLGESSSNVNVNMTDKQLNEPGQSSSGN